MFNGDDLENVKKNLLDKIFDLEIEKLLMSKT